MRRVFTQQLKLIFSRCLYAEKMFSYHRDRRAKMETTAKRFIEFIAPKENISKAKLKVKVLILLSFQGEKGDPGANVSGLTIK